MTTKNYFRYWNVDWSLSFYFCSQWQIFNQYCEGVKILVELLFW